MTNGDNGNDRPKENSKLTVLVVSMVAALVILAVTTTYSAYVATNNHHNSCARTDLALDAVNNLLTYLVTPPPGTTVSAARARQDAALELHSAMILNEARC